MVTCLKNYNKDSKKVKNKINKMLTKYDRQKLLKMYRNSLQKVFKIYIVVYLQILQKHRFFLITCRYLPHAERVIGT
jgi:hypothetical protein